MGSFLGFGLLSFFLRFDKFGLVGLVWYIWFGMFGLVSLVWYVWFSTEGLVWFGLV